MKLHYFLVLAFSLGFSNCKKETQEPFIPKNYLANFITEKPQLFDLGTIEYKEIVGKHGTKVIFSRDFFELKENQKVQLELIELYDFKEILYRNIQTVTTNDELLETSGVLKVVFTSNGKKLKLKKDSNIIVYPPKGKLKDNDIFLSETDSIGNIKWEITNQNYVEALEDVGGGISIMYRILEDSLPSFKKRVLVKNTIRKKVRDYFVLNNNSWSWINIDRFAKDLPRINFSLKDKLNKFSGFGMYIKYDSLKSFVTFSRLKNDLLFEDIPVSNRTNIIIFGSSKNQTYYDKIELHKSHNNSELKLNMKKISEKELQRIINKNI